MAQRSYTEAQKAEAVALAEQVGPTAAARQLGIAPGTVKRWVAPSGVLDTHGRPDPLAGLLHRPAGMRWADDVPLLMDRLAEVAGRAVDACGGAIDAGRGRDAQAFATTAAIAVDKLQLLAGRATSRSESATLHVRAEHDGRLAEQVAQLRAELAGKRPAVIEAVTDDEP